jgi:hypothetical protein
MPFPKDHKKIDLMFGIPTSEDNSEWYESVKPLLRDEESRNMFKMPVQYIFEDIPKTGGIDDKVAWAVEQMDKWNIEKAFVEFHHASATALAALERYRDRFLFNVVVNPVNGMDEVRMIKRYKREFGVDASPSRPR